MTDNADPPTTPTITAPPPSEESTQAEASSRPAIAPPSRLPDEDEFAQSALASRQPPPWWSESFIGSELGRFAGDARALREGRDRQHAEVMAALRDQGAKQEASLAKVTADMANLARELTANLELLSGEFRRHRDASDARDAVQDGRIHQLERQLATMKAEILGALPDAMAKILEPYLGRIEALERELADLLNGSARTQTPAPG